MLRTLSLTLAVAAILAIPFSQADARSRGGWSGHSFGRVGVHHVGVGRGGFVRGGFVHHRGFIGRRHFIGGPIFIAGPTCWRWVPTVYGWRRVWICNPYPYY